jgi:general secretion pathway protein E
MTVDDVALELARIGALPAPEGEAAETRWRELSLRELRALTRLSPSAFADFLAGLRALPRGELAALKAGDSLAASFSPTFLRQRALFPYRGADGAARLALADPTATDDIEAAVLVFGEAPRLEIVAFEDVALALDHHSEASNASPAEPGAETDSAEALRDLASGAPVVQALDALFERAAAQRATDIHIEPLRRAVQLRLRVDGVLRPSSPPRGVSARALVSRLKILAGLNIAEQRLPQDGRLQIEAGGRGFDVRLATMPTQHGEAAILRLLERSGRVASFDELGFSPRDAGLLRRRLEAPNGMVIVTGPTGSGKTTTLAAFLASLDSGARKILTIEDPIEYEIPGAQQSQARPAVGLTFANALRAFLRQDPDVIMVGEIRDAETAKIAVQAALTGHLVLTTLHTNSAASAITRLADIGVERYLIASTLSAVVSQRLARRLCPLCRRETILTAQAVEADPRLFALGLKPGARVFEPVGCEACGFSGYRGRQALFETLDMTDALRRGVLAGGDDDALEREARAEGLTPLMQDGVARALAGITSVDEVFRVAAFR